ncbi:MlaD family protein [Persephonella sp. IF05-L8]|uniref:MlaD family protein n=1 Tax=Persephonella sp. IF05-L8 TaxID=1158338 RepID=UPI000497ABB1
MNTAFRVGLFVLIISSIAGYLIITFSGKELGVSTKEYVIYFDAVEGLSQGADVQVKGVKVGRVEKIEFDKGKVKVVIGIKENIPIYKNAKAYVRTLGLMGDKYIYIDPGTPNAGELAEGQTITNAQVYASTEEAFSTVQEIAKKVGELIDNLNDALGKGNLREMIENIKVLAKHTDEMVVENRKGVKLAIDNIVAITDSLRRDLPPLIQKIDRIATNLEAIAGENREDIRELIKNLKETSVALKEKTPKVLDKIGEAAQTIKGTVGENREDIKVAIQKIREASEKLDRILAKIDEGKGTIGKLVNDDSLYDNANKGIKEFSKPFAVINQSQLDIMLYAEKHTGNDDAKAGIAGKFAPGSNSYIYVGLLTNSNGTVTKRKEYIDNTGTREEIERNYGILFDIQYAHKLFDIGDTSFWVRGGLKDSTGAAGTDLYLNRRLAIKADLYNFDRKYSIGNQNIDNPQLDIYFQYKMYKYPVFVRLGGSDLLNSDVMGVYIGGGFMFRDNDIKYLLGSVPKP